MREFSVTEQVSLYFADSSEPTVRQVQLDPYGAGGDSAGMPTAIEGELTLTFAVNGEVGQRQAKVCLPFDSHGTIMRSLLGNTLAQSLETLEQYPSGKFMPAGSETLVDVKRALDDESQDETEPPVGETNPAADETIPPADETPVATDAT